MDNSCSNFAMKETTENRTNVRETRAENLRLLRFPLADSVPAGGRDIRRPAQREPDRADRYPAGNTLFGGDATYLLEHEVAREHLAVGFPELVGYRQSEFTQSHSRPIAQSLNDTTQG